MKKNSEKPQKAIRQVNVKHIKLTKESRKSLRKVKDSLYGNVADAIECGDWHIPSDTYEYLDIMLEMEKSMREFFSIPAGIIVEIESFDSNILSFEKGHSREDLAK